MKLYIDFKPALSADALELRLDRDISELKAKQVSTLLEGLVPKNLVKLFAKYKGVGLPTYCFK